MRLDRFELLLAAACFGEVLGTRCLQGWKRRIKHSEEELGKSLRHLAAEHRVRDEPGRKWTGGQSHPRKHADIEAWNSTHLAEDRAPIRRAIDDRRPGPNQADFGKLWNGRHCKLKIGAHR